MKPEEINYKVFNRTNLGLKKSKPSIFMKERLFGEGVEENMRLLEQARVYYDALSDFRKRAIRARKYYRGDQWSDVIYNPDDKTWEYESDYIKKQGKIPLKQNIIRSHIRNQLGQYRMSESKTIAIARKPEQRSLGDIVSAALDYAQHINMLDELDTRAYETGLLTGMVVQKQGFGYIKERDMEDILVENRNVHRMFFNPDVMDIRGTDVRMIGEILDVPIDQIVSAFAQTKKEEEVIRQIFKEHEDTIDVSKGLSADDVDRLSFLAPATTGKGRIYEIWYLKNVWKYYVHDEATGKYFMTKRKKEEIQRENAERIAQAAKHGIPEDEVPLLIFTEKNEQVWYVKYLTYQGQSLWEGETKFQHGEHPYTLFLYPLIDGEVWGLVEDIIDQQRYINRTIILMDFIMGASAKGVLLVPEDAIPEGKTPEDFADEWVKFNGVITYKAKPGVDPPQQVSSNSIQAGFKELINLQLMLIQDISGTQDAVQGKRPNAGTPASLFEQETANAMMSSYDYLKSFAKFKERRDRKMLKNILQFYDKPRHIAVSGLNGSNYTMYDPGKVKVSEYDIVTTQAPNTPSYRGLLEEKLLQLLQAQLIDLEMYLKHSSMPFAETLLEDIKQKQQELQQTGRANIDPNMMQATGADPKAVELLRKASAPSMKAA